MVGQSQANPRTLSDRAKFYGQPNLYRPGRGRNRNEFVFNRGHPYLENEEEYKSGLTPLVLKPGASEQEKEIYNTLRRYQREILYGKYLRYIPLYLFG